MWNKLKSFFVAIGFLLLSYMLFGFITQEWNVREWDWYTRVLYLGFAVFCNVVYNLELNRSDK